VKNGVSSGESKCVLWYYELKSVVSMQRTFFAEYGREPPKKVYIYKMNSLFNEAACICEGKGSSKRPVTEAKVNEDEVAFIVKAN
jgi:hypothetical protein